MERIDRILKFQVHEEEKGIFKQKELLLLLDSTLPISTIPVRPSSPLHYWGGGCILLLNLQFAF